MQGKQQGFTLLELMVVVVVIGIILTFVVRSVGDGGRSDRILREAQRIGALVELVGEESVLKSTVIGLHFVERGYEFMHYRDQQWQGVAGDDLLKPHELDEAMALQLLVEGFSVDLTEQGQAAGGSDEAGSGVRPQVVFLPSGERTPFELSLYYEDDRSGVMLTVPPLGAVARQRLEGQW